MHEAGNYCFRTFKKIGMKRVVFLSSLLIVTNFCAQKKKTGLSNWSNKDSEIAQKTFSKYDERKSAEEIKKELTTSQKVLKIEIINEGDWDQLRENSSFRFVKVNDGNFDQIIHSENLDLVANSFQTNNWKDENGNVSFRSISEPLKISQEFVTAKNKKGEQNSQLKAVETYKTNYAVISFSLQIFTYRKDNNPKIKTELSKTINIYAEDKLIKTLKYSYADLCKVGGISLKNFQLANNK